MKPHNVLQGHTIGPERIVSKQVVSTGAVPAADGESLHSDGGPALVAGAAAVQGVSSLMGGTGMLSTTCTHDRVWPLAIICNHQR